MRPRGAPVENLCVIMMHMAVRFTFDPEKATEAIVYLSSLGLPALSKYKLCKLLVLADKHHLVRFGRTITGDRICAMEYGPVPSASLDMMSRILGGEELSQQGQALAERVAIDRRYTHPRFAAVDKDFQAHALSQSDLESLQAVANEHGKKGFDELKALTHEMIAYKRAWENKSNNAPPIAFEDFFEEDDEALAGVFEEMVETDAMRKAFGPAF
jgi:uncharacterized phage-associated protein